MPESTSAKLPLARSQSFSLPGRIREKGGTSPKKLHRSPSTGTLPTLKEGFDHTKLQWVPPGRAPKGVAQIVKRPAGSVTMLSQECQTLTDAQIKQEYRDMGLSEVQIAEIQRRDEMNLPKFGGKVKTGANELVKMAVQEIGWDTISKYQEAKEEFQLSESNIAGIRMGEKIYKPGDAFIIDNPIRYKCTKELEKTTKRAVNWIETSGMIEIGSGMNHTLPIAAFCGGSATATFGFTGSALIRYKTTQPYAIGWRRTPQEILDRNIFNMPTSAMAARGLSAGAQFEFSGKGTIHGHAMADAVAGGDLGVATAGVGLQVGATLDTAREYTIKVISLNGANKVRVIISDVDEETAAFSAKLKAGILFKQGALAEHIPFGLGNGALLPLAEKMDEHSIEDLATKFTSVQASYEAHIKHKDTEIFSYDIDLNAEGAEEAYGQLFKLDPTVAWDMAKISGSGVTVATVDEKEMEYGHDLGLSVLGAKLALANVLNSEKRGELIRADGKKYIYRDKEYSKMSSCFFTDTENIKYQAITVRDGEDAPDIPAFHFYYKRDDKETLKEEVDRFFSFAGSMGIKPKGEVKRELVEISGPKSLFSSADDTTVIIDMYFTQLGIKLIDDATYEDALQAYLKVCEMQHPDFAANILLEDSEAGAEAREICEEYARKKRTLFCCGKSRDTIEEYKLTCGRDIEVDGEYFVAARRFANRVQNLTDMSNARQITKFFNNFGKSKGLEFREAIAALARLATPKATIKDPDIAKREGVLIHQLCMVGAGIRWEAADEGAITHPREEVTKTLTALTAEPTGLPDPKKKSDPRAHKRSAADTISGAIAVDRAASRFKRADRGAARSTAEALDTAEMRHGHKSEVLEEKPA